MTVKKIKIPIYEFDLEVIVTSKDEDKKYIEIFNDYAKKRKLLKVDDSGYEALFSPPSTKTSSYGSIAFRRGVIKVTELSHEVNHCVGYIASVVGLDESYPNEASSYLTEYIFKRVLKSFKNSDVKIILE